jgi:deazaflavin-dependent oxidoreductase (nitroreductase family)
MSDVKTAPWIFRKVLNPIVKLVVGPLGIKLRGGELLTVVGRKSGQPRSVPANPMAFNGKRYLVAPRGQTEWVKNLRVAGTCELQSGRKRERCVAVEIADEEKPPILREYLNRWYMETGAVFDVPKDASLDDLAAIASRHPVFEIRPVAG